MSHRSRAVCFACLACLLLVPVPIRAEPGSILDVMELELKRSVENLSTAAAFPMYFIEYEVTEERTWRLSAVNGAFEAPRASLRRFLDVDLRVGSQELDSTHEIRGGNWQDNNPSRRIVEFPIEDDPPAIRAAIWAETEYQFQKAQERYTKVLSNRQVKVTEEDTSADFSSTSPQKYSETVSATPIDTLRWRTILARASEYLTHFDFVYDSGVNFAVTDRATYQVNSEGSRLLHENHYLRLDLNVSGMAQDGMELYRYESFSAATVDHLPDEATVMQAADRITQELKGLISAPLVEPYIGPAILRNRASGVFFHEIFGHRIEAHRQKSASEGQTFTKKVGELILPEFISVYDDPTLPNYRGTDLRGYYRFDDEGTPAQRVPIVEKGILRNFLTSRSPIANFPTSNGHARRECGYDAVSRQGNLIVESSKSVSYAKLREMLIDECKRQAKPYGLVFDDISGGFTMTNRAMPQAFKVIPLLVYRVYADGRPDEIVRGVDVVGTPLTSFSKILMTADDGAVFNGTCGAESGWVPVAAVSPSILVSEIEVEKRQKEQEKPPILPPPTREGGEKSEVTRP